MKLLKSFGVKRVMSCWGGLVLFCLYIYLLIYFLGVAWCACEVKGQLAGTSSLLPPCGSWGSDPSCRVWEPVLVHTAPYFAGLMWVLLFVLGHL